jgi:hypothetical protein
VGSDGADPAPITTAAANPERVGKEGVTPWKNNGFGNGGVGAYNRRQDDSDRELSSDGKMRKTLTTLRCVPRYGYDHAEVRTIDLDLLDTTDEHELLAAAQNWFAHRGIADAVYDIAVDDNGFFVIVNDEAYRHAWGEALL